MNQLDLILENIRLGQIEKLYQEAETDLELIRGQRLINESMLQVRGALLQEGFDAPDLGVPSFGAMFRQSPIGDYGRDQISDMDGHVRNILKNSDNTIDNINAYNPVTGGLLKGVTTGYNVGSDIAGSLGAGIEGRDMAGQFGAGFGGALGTAGGIGAVGLGAAGLGVAGSKGYNAYKAYRGKR